MGNKSTKRIEMVEIHAKLEVDVGTAEGTQGEWM